ncbi:MAG: FecR domain-containing protein [Armatimonadetes bacterium]|nr:FecR domain-containing protein [Armatimonadota bacterium]
MNKGIIKLLTIIFCVFFIAILSFKGSAYSQESAGGWKIVVKSKGIVESKKFQENEWKEIFSSRPLKAEDFARTLKNSEAKILIQGGHVIRLYENTQIQLAKLDEKASAKGFKFIQNIGKIWTHVEKLFGKDEYFEVQTPTAVLAVRGTDFYSQVEADGTTKVGVGSGQIEVSAAGITLIIPAGQTTTITPNNPPAPPVNDPGIVIPYEVSGSSAPKNEVAAPQSGNPPPPPIIHPPSEPYIY